ncbi:MAG TPA: hypothetical protein QGF58_22315 [Myxococcota bacterium]|nr:hypothetical protein [Myxococcota bacterium]
MSRITPERMTQLDDNELARLLEKLAREAASTSKIKAPRAKARLVVVVAEARRRGW